MTKAVYILTRAILDHLFENIAVGDVADDGVVRLTVELLTKEQYER